MRESARKFRWEAQQEFDDPPVFGREFLEMLRESMISAQYIQDWQERIHTDAVLLAPATTFLTWNHPVSYHFWLSVGSNGWASRLSQPLTHPYVLSRQWQPGQIWTDVDEREAGQESLYRLVLGLTRRCRSKIFLVYSDLSEQGTKSGASS